MPKGGGAHIWYLAPWRHQGKYAAAGFLCGLPGVNPKHLMLLAVYHGLNKVKFARAAPLKSSFTETPRITRFNPLALRMPLNPETPTPLNPDSHPEP